ncbi:MAG: LON peptidase substrate-binding domain-containing protein [Vicinamibacterales bacterium]
MLPSILPIFPLPATVLFPKIFLPLHIFEPRYREMVADALAGDHMIGVVLLKKGWERDYESAPPIYPIGCAGLITHAEPLEGGRYNIVLQGLERFRVAAEEEGRSYRRARIEPLFESVDAPAREALGRERSRIEDLLDPPLEAIGLDPKYYRSMPDEDLVNALSQYLDFDPLEKQALLACDGALHRARSLIDLLEMRKLLQKSAWNRTMRAQ